VQIPVVFDMEKNGVCPRFSGTGIINLSGHPDKPAAGPYSRLTCDTGNGQVRIHAEAC
jgi:hypothetical protein